MKIENPAVSITVIDYSILFVKPDKHTLFLYEFSIEDIPVYIIYHSDSSCLVSTRSETEAISFIEDWWNKHKPATELHSTFVLDYYREYKDISGDSKIILSLPYSGNFKILERYLPQALKGGQ